MIFPPENKFMKTLCQSLAILGLILYIVYIFWYHPFYNSSFTIFTTKISRPEKNPNFSPTNITHLVFGLAGSSNTWNTKKHYIESWWRPNQTRGLLFLDRAPPTPWPTTSPPYCVSQDTSRYQMYNRHKLKHAIRMARVVEETFNAMNDSVRWYIMTDDDTIIFVDNLVEVLRKYDHTEYSYIGMNSECIASNVLFSFGMAFGGAAYALSFPLAKALAMNLDVCIKRYPSLYGSDHILQSCIADLGVSLKEERGFHQIDLHRDISGFLSAHPQTPLISLHHLDIVDPIFPTLNRSESVSRLMRAAKTDSSRLLQQSFCYSNSNNWTFSISWGYSIQIYEAVHPPSVLQKPLETFGPWNKWAKPPYMFNTRFLSNNPCEAPHLLFFDNVEEMKGSYIVTSYSRRWPRRTMAACTSSGNHSADYISTIRVLSPMRRHNWVGSRRECCDIVEMSGVNTTRLKLRHCMKNEIVP